MKMAKASDREVLIMARWFQQREENGETVPDWRRVVFGYRVLVDNACDPNQDTLEWKPGIIVPGDSSSLSLVVTRRGEQDYHCAAKGDTARWAAGRSSDEAIGNWIRSHKPFPVELPPDGKTS